MMKRILSLLLLLVIIPFLIQAQGVGINSDNSTADPSAMLDVKSTAKGVLVPRMTMTQRDAISAPATSLLIYQIDGTSGFYYYNGSVWKMVGDEVDGSVTNELQTMSASLTGDTLHISQGNFLIIPGISAANPPPPPPFTCGGTLTDSRDGNTYATVQIGTQCWMAENLRYNAAGSQLNPANPTTTYGRLYDWATLMNGATTSSSNPSGVQGICPSGWHVPSDAEWNEMELALGMPGSGTTATGYRGTHGTDMKSTTGWNSGGNGTNSSGFNAFPAGYYSGSFFFLGDFAYFWSSTEFSGSNAWKRFLGYGNTGVGRNSSNKTYGHSCRCVKD
jgi:uncharacterized protein (TIGR02145 family)